VAAVLQKTPQSVYNWAKWWREDGLAGILNGNKGGAPVKLTAEMLNTAGEFAAKSPLTLAMIKRHVQEQHSDAPDFSLFRLSAGLRKRGFNFKRTRLSLKKTG
jgi:transposase